MTPSIPTAAATAWAVTLPAVSITDHRSKPRSLATAVAEGLMVSATVVFGSMLRNITAAAERTERAGDTPLSVSR